MKNYMEEQIISFKTAKLAKEVGFPIDITEYYYGNDDNPIKWNFIRHYKDYFPAPHQALLQKWLREKHNIIVYVDYRSMMRPYYHIITDDDEMIGNIVNFYEDALEEGLYKALTNLKEKLKKRDKDDE